SEDSPLFMGFKSGFEKNQASEDRVTIQSGPFEGGTTRHVSQIKLHLDQWYNQDSRYQRVGKMFCPAHAEQGLVEGVGDNLGTDSGMSECPADPAEDARNKGFVGHSQKNAQAREDDSPVIMRRDFNSTDDEHAGLHFVALQRGISDFEDTRRAMNGTDAAEAGGVGTRHNNGILQYMTVQRRGNFLVPPRGKRALPEPN
ncbi:MAG: Tat pathway signal protein, partial [Halapricum sp.]